MDKVKLPFGIASGRTPSAPMDLEFYKIDFGVGKKSVLIETQPSHDSSINQAKHHHNFKALIARVRCGAGGDGPPGMIHGGLSAWILDECMGATAWINDYPCVASKLEYYLRSMAPLNRDLIVKSEVKEVIEDQIIVEAILVLPKKDFDYTGLFSFKNLSDQQNFGYIFEQINNQQILVESKSIFHILKKEQFEKLGALAELENFSPKTNWKFHTK